MATLVIPNTTLSNPADKTEIQENFTAVTDWANGNVGNANVATNAAIDVTKLSAYYVEQWVQLQFVSDGTTSFSAATLNVPLDAVPIPGSNGDTAWVLTDVSWVTNDAGTAEGIWKLQTGNYTGAGATWSGADVAGSSTTMMISTNNAGAHAKTLEGASISIAYTATNPVMLALVPTFAGTDVCSAANSFLRVTARLIRPLQAG